jgi:hypothetical protein
MHVPPEQHGITCVSIGQEQRETRHEVLALKIVEKIYGASGFSVGVDSPGLFRNAVR